MISSERFSQIECTRGLEGLSTEEKLHRLYDLYCQTGCEDYLGDILLNAERLGFGIAYNVLLKSSHFYQKDFMDYLQDITIRLLGKLREEYREGKRQKDIVHTVRRFYKLRAWDIRDSLAANLNGREMDSLDALNEGPDGKPVEKIGGEDEIDNEDLILAQEKAELSWTIIKMYIQCIMDSSEAPSRLMSLFYARILYQLEMRYNWKQIEAAADKLITKDHRTKYSDFEKMVIAFNSVQETKKTTSPGWALERMGCQNFFDLRFDSEQAIHEFFDDSLFWQRPFLQKLLQKSDCDDALVWKDVVYTEHYDAKQTSALAKSMHEVVLDQLMDLIEADDDLDRDVMRLDTPIKTMMQTLGRGNKYVTHDER